jgi:hypothetical protein
LTKAAIVTNGDQVIESRGMADGGQALTDTGFANIGARPTRDDLGLGVVDSIVGQPLSYARQYLANPAGPNPDPFTVTVGGLSDNFGLMTTRVAVDGTFKVPSLRNVAQTPPYFHNGGQGNLQQVIQFYSRGGDRRNVANGDTSGTGKLGEDDPTALAPSGSNVDAKVTNIGLGPQDQADLLAFLKSLTDDRVRCHAAPFDHPELTVSHGVDPGRKPDGAKAAENHVTIMAVGNTGLPRARCALMPNQGSVDQLPAVLAALDENGPGDLGRDDGDGARKLPIFDSNGKKPRKLHFEKRQHGDKTVPTIGIRGE